jgi:hypothetical protein
MALTASHYMTRSSLVVQRRLQGPRKIAQARRHLPGMTGFEGEQIRHDFRSCLHAKQTAQLDQKVDTPMGIRRLAQTPEIQRTPQRLDSTRPLPAKKRRKLRNEVARTAADAGFNQTARCSTNRTTGAARFRLKCCQSRSCRRRVRLRAQPIPTLIVLHLSSQAYHPGRCRPVKDSSLSCALLPLYFLRIG